MHTTNLETNLGFFFTDFYDSYADSGDSCDNIILNVTITSNAY